MKPDPVDCQTSDRDDERGDDDSLGPDLGVGEVLVDRLSFLPAVLLSGEPKKAGHGFGSESASLNDEPLVPVFSDHLFR